MQIENSFAAAYDFNRYTQCVPRPGPLLAPQILTPSPLRPINLWPCPFLPRPVKKIAPCSQTFNKKGSCGTLTMSGAFLSPPTSEGRMSRGT